MQDEGVSFWPLRIWYPGFQPLLNHRVAVGGWAGCGASLSLYVLPRLIDYSKSATSVRVKMNAL